MSWAAGKTALVTGGSQGIGHATAAALAALGASVTVTGTRAGFGDYDDPIPGVRYIRCDMKDAGARSALAAAFDRLDILVNNAGGGSANEFSQDEFEAVLDLNLNGVMDLSMKLFPLLKASGAGAVVNVGSMASFLAIKEAPAYTASKAGLLGLTRALGDKWAPDNVRVNLVAPGFIATRMTARMRTDADLEKRLMKAIPMRRWGRPEDIADAILFLASPAAGYITGQSLAIDGGLQLR
jgi:3-oxoacyl-[acyl-carrier protein] reductase